MQFYDSRRTRTHDPTHPRSPPNPHNLADLHLHMWNGSSRTITFGKYLIIEIIDYCFTSLKYGFFNHLQNFRVHVF